MKFRYLALIPAVTLGASLVGCTTNPYTGQQEVNPAAIGAGVGAVAGAVIGNNVGGNQRRNRNVGALLGALAGGSVGYYMDSQQNALRQQLRGTGVSVTRSGNNIILNMPGDITFPNNQYTIQSQFYPVLNSVAKVLVHYDKTLVDVAGYTSSTGTASYNMQLSRKRAASVANYLIAQGVQPVRIQATGYGEADPIASNATAAGRAQNRRVTITLSPVTSSGG
ncbi:OmpA family protein [Acidihalobacter ferrooxydans]|uniref:Cell envelope biogenesis protein OmpA n=1 Tax=Acidihalobacter ferrooxydans TaxID=1765967 RepID=A0A1P8UKJ8_9GAMM|nr:OmpA family protein [Acidihalobacter ferrooxydans]APZ44358.1 cell envelope biogenesis protein OmpA [Acidihalobacter ferrooxydans]